MTDHHAVLTGPQLAASRRALLVTFGLIGIGFAAWMARLPAVRSRLDLTATELGSLLVVGAVGALIAVLVAGGIVARIGSRRTLMIATVTFALGMCVIAASLATQSVPLFVIGLFISDASGPLSNVPINTNAAAIQRLMNRSVLAQFHAAFSIGAVVGAGIGALCARAGVDIGAQIAATAILTAAVRLILASTACQPTAHEIVDRRQAADAATGEAPSTVAATSPWRLAASAWREPRTLMVGVLVFAGSLSEGTASTWLALAVVTGFSASDSRGALVLATFTAAMTVVRFAGPNVIDRLGRQRTILYSGVLSGLGLAAFGFAPSMTLAWLGVVIWGCGAALLGPVAISAASDEPLHAAVRVSVVTSFGSVAQIIAPPVLGFLVDSIGARHMIATIILAMIMSVVLAPAVRPANS